MANVIIANKLPQVLSLTILGDDGAPTELRLPANATTSPIAEERITGYVRDLAAKGHVRIRSAE